MILQADSISVRYGSVLALDGFSVSVAEGERVALIGPNGAGKSTALKAFAGVAPISGGKVLLDGADQIGRRPRELVRAGLTLAPQGRRLFGSMSVRENLEMGAFARADSRAFRNDLRRWSERFPEIGSRLNLRASLLSGGQQQIVALMRALMARPRVLMLDEPSMGVAPVVLRRIGQELHRLNEEDGLTILMVEQNIELAFEVAERVVVMSLGKDVHVGTPAELRDPELLAALFFGSSAS